MADKTSPGADSSLFVPQKTLGTNKTKTVKKYKTEKGAKKKKKTLSHTL